MATIQIEIDQIEIDDEKIQQLLRARRGMAVLLEPTGEPDSAEILQAETTEHLKAEPGEQTSGRRGYRNGTHERKLTTRVGTIELGSARSNWRCPEIEKGPSSAALFQRYQRSEEALVLTLMQMVVQGVSTRRVKDITTELSPPSFHHRALRKGVLEVDSFPSGRGSRRASRGLGRAPVGPGAPVPDRRRHAAKSSAAEGRAVRATAMLAVGISEDGQREILGLSGGPQRD